MIFFFEIQRILILTFFYAIFIYKNDAENLFMTEIRFGLVFHRHQHQQSIRIWILCTKGNDVTELENIASVSTVRSHWKNDRHTQTSLSQRWRKSKDSAKYTILNNSDLKPTIFISLHGYSVFHEIWVEKQWTKYLFFRVWFGCEFCRNKIER